MPLAQVLDVENGIGYKGIGGIVNNLIEGAPFSQSSEHDEIVYDQRSRFKLKKFIEAIESNALEIIIAPDEVRNFENVLSSTPDSFSVLASIFNTAKQEHRILLRSITGPSGGNLIGRFCHLSNEIESETKKLLSQEEDLYPNKIFSEIAHLPQDRVGNVLMRPHLRTYEIPYLAKSTLSIDKQININDLYISIVGNRIVLKSKKLNKEIVPRLTSAHNYSFNSLPVYNFLCDIQSDALRSNINWSWEFLSSREFLPRVRYRNIILSPATWNLKYDKVKQNDKETNDQGIILFTSYLRELRIPRLAYISEGDNDLLIDTRSLVGSRLLFNELKKKKSITIIESFFSDSANEIVSDSTHKYVNEVLLPFVKSATLINPTDSCDLETQKQNDKIERQFLPGSEWLYYKIYTGIKTADEILVDCFSILKELVEKKAIDHYFFIRYSDPKFHIRLRLHLLNKSMFNEVLEHLNEKWSSLINEKRIWRVQIDTYSREIERYGSEIIYSEMAFAINSSAVCKILDKINEHDLNKYRWLICMTGVDKLLGDSGYTSIEDKLKIMTVLKDNFGQEFKIDQNKNLREYIKDKYRAESSRINHFLEIKSDSTVPAYIKYVLREIFGKQSEDLSPVILLIKENSLSDNHFSDIIMSHIHMFINRFLSTSHRKQEFILYSFLYKFYLSEHEKSKYHY